MKVVFTGPASRELGEIAQYVAQDDPPAAERLVLDIRRGCLALSDHPERGRVAGRKRGIAIRRLVFRPYLVFYSVSPDSVRIHRVIHGSRSPRLLLKGLDLF